MNDDKISSDNKSSDKKISEKKVQIKKPVVPQKKADQTKSTQSSVKSSGTESVKNPSANKTLIIIVSILLIAIIASIACLYVLWEKQEVKQTRLISSLKADVDQYLLSQSQLRDEINNRVNTELSETKRSIIELQKLAGKSSRDWAIAETEYLLKLANHRLQLEGDIQTTITALMIADAKIKELTEPALLPVRKQLADEISALKTTNIPDIQGMVLVLDSMQSKSPQMRLKMSISPETRKQTAQDSNERISFKDWEKVIERVWKELRTLVVIKKHDQPLAPVLTVEQQQTIRHILQLKIQGIRTALLNKQPEMFFVSIKETLGWLKEHFNPDDANVSLLESRLQDFKDVQLKIDLPDISGSLNTLRSLKKQLKIIRAPEESTTAPTDAVVDKAALPTMETL